LLKVCVILQEGIQFFLYSLQLDFCFWHFRKFFDQPFLTSAFNSFSSPDMILFIQESISLSVSVFSSSRKVKLRAMDFFSRPSFSLSKISKSLTSCNFASLIFSTVCSTSAYCILEGTMMERSLRTAGNFGMLFTPDLAAVACFTTDCQLK